MIKKYCIQIFFSFLLILPGMPGIIDLTFRNFKELLNEA
jgi:hypothetical protein